MCECPLRIVSELSTIPAIDEATPSARLSRAESTGRLELRRAGRLDASDELPAIQTDARNGEFRCDRLRGAQQPEAEEPGRPLVRQGRGGGRSLLCRHLSVQ